MIDLLKTAPRWFLMLYIAGSTAFGAAAGTMVGILAVDSLSRIERYARDEWQTRLAVHSEQIGSLQAVTRQHSDEFRRRAEDDERFRAEMRREFDRLNLRLSQKGR